MSSIVTGDALAELKQLPDNSIDCCVTSPPYYGLRNYGVIEQIGLERSVQEYLLQNNGEQFFKILLVIRRHGIASAYTVAFFRVLCGFRFNMPGKL